MGIISGSGSFRGRFGDHFRVGDHFGVGIISGAVQAPSMLIRFQTKTELFCSVFKKMCVHTYRFRIVFARPHYKAVSVLKRPLYPQCACSNELDACAFQDIAPRNWRHSILVPRGRAPFGQHQESRLLITSNDIPVLNGFLNTID